METIVLDNKNSVVTSVLETNYVNNASTDSAVVETSTPVFITLTNTETVLVEVDNSQVVVTGLLGPAGKDGVSEENIVYSKRTDFIDDNTLYKGEALPGSSENSSTWRIRKINMYADGDVTETWADGVATFDKVWANRSSYTYE